DVVVAARGDPRRAEVAAAHVRADAHAFRLARQGAVDVADVGQVLVLAVAADLIDVGALARIVEVREARVVNLQVGAAEPAEFLDLPRVDFGEGGPELLHVGIDGRIDGRSAAAVVDHAGRGFRQLGR